MEQNYEDYIVFVLGADNFRLSKYIRKQMWEHDYGMDELYDFCKLVATDFEESEENMDLSISQYTALEKFLDKNTQKYIEMFNEGEF